MNEQNCPNVSHRALTLIQCGVAPAASIWFPSPSDVEWQFPEDRTARAEIAFNENKKKIFSLECGHNVILSLRYPGKQRRGTAKIAIGNSTSNILINGEVDRRQQTDMPFVAAWTGKTLDPADLDELMKVLFSGEGLTVRAEGASYLLPMISPELISKYNGAC
jgi:hypothetical protein